MKPPSVILFFALFFGIAYGCDNGPAPATGGTTGTLKFGDAVTSDIVITVHKAGENSAEPIGFGTSQHDGSFVLYKPGASEPLFLEPGDYRCTLESVGPPVKLPKEYQDPSRSPLKFSWSSTSSTIELDAPAKILTQ